MSREPIMSADTKAGPQAKDRLDKYGYMVDGAATPKPRLLAYAGRVPRQPANIPERGRP